MTRNNVYIFPAKEAVIAEDTRVTVQQSRPGFFYIKR